jgi:hypothetical protein
LKKTPRGCRAAFSLLTRTSPVSPAGALNSTRQTGSVLGVALFGSLIGQSNAFMAGTPESLVISAAVLLTAAAAIWWGGAKISQ